MRKFNLSNAPTCVKSEVPGMRAAVRNGGNELLIMDDIGEDMFGDGISAVNVRDFLNQKAGPVTVRINSFGGDVYEGLAIYNAFLEHGDVHGIIDGIAFSAASIVAMGCKTLQMNKASDLGIHRSWTLTAGNSNQLKAAVEWLDVVDQHQVEIFTERTGQSADQITAWLDGTADGTVWNAGKAVELGFADTVIEPKQEAPKEQKQTAAARIYRQRQKALARSLVNR